jgi:hypothetical protein
LSLLAASSIATLIAMALPWLPHRLGRDPANDSGPPAAVIQHLLSVADLHGDCGHPGALAREAAPVIPLVIPPGTTLHVAAVSAGRRTRPDM